MRCSEVPAGYRHDTVHHRARGRPGTQAAVPLQRRNRSDYHPRQRLPESTAHRNRGDPPPWIQHPASLLIYNQSEDKEYSSAKGQSIDCPQC